MPIKVVVVDDDPNAIAREEAILSDNPAVAVVGAAADAYEAKDVCLDLQPDVVILDVLLPDENGFDVARDLLAKMPHLQVVLVSRAEVEGFDVLARHAGAVGFLTKEDFSEQRVLDLLRVMAAQR